VDWSGHFFVKIQLDGFWEMRPEVFTGGNGEEGV
jgi:hypothetical protein